MAISNKMGSAPITLERGSNNVTISGSTAGLNAAFVNATSGAAIGIKFSAPMSQTNAALTLYAYLSAKTGSPTDVRCALYAGASGAEDDDRPAPGAPLATSASVDASAQSAATWSTFAFTGVSLTAGLTYWLVIHNATGTPTSNFPSYMTRGYNNSIMRFNAFTTTDGFATDPTALSNDAPVVIKFSDGSVVGNPYTKSNAHASNANDRGNRFQFDAAVVVNGVFLNILSATITAVKVYQGSTEVASVTLDKNQINNSGAVYFDSPVTFAAGTTYDVVGKFSGNATSGPRIDADASAPADVLACMPAGLSYVDGATPGSYSEANGFTGILLLVDNIPAAGGGASVQTSYAYAG